MLEQPVEIDMIETTADIEADTIEEHAVTEDHIDTITIGECTEVDEIEDHIEPYVFEGYFDAEDHEK